MIKVESVAIENFRGIKSLSLDLHQRNFCISGPNGTGKSGIVDAIEFALTGNITRLTGRGAGNLSVKEHGPHVDLRSDPSMAVVRLTAYSPVLNKTFVIERRVSEPGKARLEPSTADVTALVKELSQHPEFALSRREIVKYVIAEPGARSQEVQALLKLHDIEKLRKTLTTLTNNFKRGLASAESAVATARTLLISALGIEELSSAQVLDSVNRRRLLLAAAPLTTLEKDTNIKAGIELEARKSPSTVSKATASSDIKALGQFARDQGSEGAAREIRQIREILNRLQEDPALLRALERYSLLQSGLELADSNECPLCGLPWEVEELQTKIRAYLNQAQLAAKLKAELQQAIEPLRARTHNLAKLADICLSYARTLLPECDLRALASWRLFLLSLEDCQGINHLCELQGWLDDDRRLLPPEAEKELGLVDESVAALPDLTEAQTARDFLLIAQERLENYMKARAAAAHARCCFETANTISAEYAATSDEMLTSLYEEVQNDFSRYYAAIHLEDESSFSAELSSSTGKLNFEVDFYGRGTFPPGAYHSEGHQDSMGLCLYLALMKRTMGIDFKLAILDDVLMSVDAGHRKEVVRLLKSEFPATQFILTTHDLVWLNHMTNEGLIPRGSSLAISRWTVDGGPCILALKDIWAETRRELASNNIIAASSLLRNYLERITSTLAERLRAQIEYRSDGAHDFGGLIGPVVGRWKELLRSAKEAANSWNKRDEIECLAQMENSFTALYARTGIDNWMINKSLHYNEWANLQRQEIASVIDAYQAFLACFECPNCKTLLYVTPSKGRAEALRCNCNVFNLVPKPRQHREGSPAVPRKKELNKRQHSLF